MRKGIARWGVLLGLSMGTLLLMATSTAAQVRVSPEVEAAMNADIMHASALDMQSDLSRLPEAARLHISEADGRPLTDGSAVDCLVLAANLFYVSKHPLDARRTMEKAAERALALGDVRRAGLLYLNASFAAERENNADEMNRLGLRAEMLTASPLLNDEQRSEITRRILHKDAVVKGSRDASARTDRIRLAMRADSIQTEAFEHQTNGRYTDAARLYKDAAKLKPRDDPGAVDDMMLAANLLFVANRPLEARRTLEDAGERALAAGDVERGARAFIEAAFIADKQGNKAETTRLGHRAELLSVSPQLTPAQRQEIARRLRRVPIA